MFRNDSQLTTNLACCLSNRNEKLLGKGVSYMSKAIDPRTIRTRKLIVSAFNQLLVSKGFEHITVKDITELATINRATFYAHFIDKYALLEEVLTELIEDIMQDSLTELGDKEVSEQLVVQLFLGIVRIHDQMFSNCRRGYSAFTQMIDDKVKVYLERNMELRLPETAKLQAVLFSWGLYGSYVEWDKQKREPAEAFAKNAAAPLLMLLKYPQMNETR